MVRGPPSLALHAPAKEQEATPPCPLRAKPRPPSGCHCQPWGRVGGWPHFPLCPWWEESFYSLAHPRLKAPHQTLTWRLMWCLEPRVGQRVNRFSELTARPHAASQCLAPGASQGTARRRPQTCLVHATDHFLNCQHRNIRFHMKTWRSH